MKKGMGEHIGDNYVGYIGLMCDYQSEECESKGQSCGSEGESEWDKKGCGKPETTDKTPCCAYAKKQSDCMGKACLEMSLAMMKMAVDAGEVHSESGEEDPKVMMDEIVKVGKTCPDSGFPQSKDDLDAVMKEKENKMTGKEDIAGDDAASGTLHTIPAFGVVATVLAFAAVANI